MLTVLIRYKGTEDNVKAFVNEMISSGLVNEIRKEEGNISYEYFFPTHDKESVLLVDSWLNQEALDKHHSLPLMGEISKLREKYDLHMEVHKYSELFTSNDEKFIRK